MNDKTNFDRKSRDRLPPREKREDKRGGGEDREFSFEQDDNKEKRAFARKRSCWFCAKKTEPDWKSFSSFTWLINEFGKIAPGRVSGICAKHQRTSTEAIKRARCIGLVSYVSDYTAR